MARGGGGALPGKGALPAAPPAAGCFLGDGAVDAESPGGRGAGELGDRPAPGTRWVGWMAAPSREAQAVPSLQSRPRGPP